MQVRLEVIRGAKTKEMQLRLPSVIGRGGQARLKVPASTVSRHHCEIYEFEGSIAVRDLGSSNGTVVNGHKIVGPTFLTSEDELTIGPITARVHKVTERSNDGAATNAIPSPTALNPTETAPQAPESEPDVSVEDDIPTFEELPAEVTEPIVAEPIVAEPVVVAESDPIETAETDSVVVAEPVTASALDGSMDDQQACENGSGSVLHYTEPKETAGRSFVGISADETTPQVDSDIPVFDDAEPEKPQVSSDDTSLNAFFDKLDS